MATEKNQWIEPLPEEVSFEQLARAAIRAPLRDIKAVERETETSKRRDNK